VTDFYSVGCIADGKTLELLTSACIGSQHGSGDRTKPKLQETLISFGKVVAIPGFEPTNSSTQHGRNTALPASFASDLNAGAIGLVALIAAFAAVVAVLGAIVSIGVKIEKLGSGIDD
jgi:hypothetical protein